MTPTPEQRAAEVVKRLQERLVGGLSAASADEAIATAIRQAERDAIERCARVAGGYKSQYAELSVHEAHIFDATCLDIRAAILRTLSPDNQADKSKEQT